MYSSTAAQALSLLTMDLRGVCRRLGVRVLPRVAIAQSAAPLSTSAHVQAAVERERGRGRDTGRRRLSRRPLPPFREWIKGEGDQFRYPPPGRGPHWIGNTPFPLNPAFNPAPPVHQSVRDDMWRLHSEAPDQWTVRSLSSKFRVSLERTESILRLKALETEWTQQVRVHTPRGWHEKHRLVLKTLLVTSSHSLSGYAIALDLY